MKKSMLTDNPDIKDSLTLMELERREGNDRSAGILAAAILDDRLSSAIESRLRPLSKPMRDRLFGEYGAMSEFGIKIDMGFALGLYGQDAHEDLTAIRRVRNRFAHRKEFGRFDHPEIRKFCDPLKSHKHVPSLGLLLEEKAPQTPRERFFRTCQALLMAIVGENFRDVPRQPDPEYLPQPSPGKSAKSPRVRNRSGRRKPTTPQPPPQSSQG